MEKSKIKQLKKKRKNSIFFCLAFSILSFICIIFPEAPHERYLGLLTSAFAIIELLKWSTLEKIIKMEENKNA